MKAIKFARVVMLVGVAASLTACPTAPPVLTPASGSQPCPYTVTMTDATQNSTIHYTTDGSPVSISSATYTAPLSLNGAANVNAFATAPSMRASTATTASYYCQPTGPTYGNVEFDITTGSDDARADTEIDVWMYTSLGNGYQFRFVLKASGDPEWTASTPQVKTFTLNPVVPVSAVVNFNIALVEHDSILETDDNWNMQTLRVLLYNQTTDKQCVLSVSGNPAARLTGSSGASEPAGCSN